MMVLLCVTPGELYVDEGMDVWKPCAFIEGQCQVCDEDIDGTDGFQNYKDDSFIHSLCVTEVLPCQMFPAYEQHSSMSAIMKRFLTVFQAAEREFTRHMLDKGDSWLQTNTDYMFTLTQKVAAKLLLAESRDDAYGECIDLLLCATMLAQKYLIDAAQDDAEEAGAIPF